MRNPGSVAGPGAPEMSRDIAVFPRTRASRYRGVLPGAGVTLRA